LIPLCYCTRLANVARALGQLPLSEFEANQVLQVLCVFLDDKPPDGPNDLLAQQMATLIDYTEGAVN
jgi:hypothetical protein